MLPPGVTTRYAHPLGVLPRTNRWPPAVVSSWVTSNFYTYLPLDVSAFDYQGNTLEDWCKSWMGPDYSPPLGANDWYEGGHQAGVHIWSPPLAAALEALKQVARSRPKRPFQVTHVVLIQRLLHQEEWRQRFEKDMDFWFVLHPGTVWPNSAFEPLFFGISFKMFRNYPWLVRQ